MDAQELMDLGFEICAGRIDRAGVNYGTLTPTGALLLPDGEDLVLALREASGEPVEAKRGPGRPKKEGKAE